MSIPIYSTPSSDLLASISLSASEFASLRTAAVEAKSVAYCPYSKFRVGAALLAPSGRIIKGGNVENASYPVTTCAERTAICSAVTTFGEKSFRAVAVATDVAPPASPCGMCRQALREFCDLKTPVIMFDKDENFSVLLLEQLLPLSFGPESLPPPDVLAVSRGET
ncbi:hypothetical protein Cpir12675_004212 [Ceratocystis pirilliformis]|uniref:Cytidine deaminase n=1 Tax=Ceratocystis pirilliformis TaxID=259994 RepID=A0ABR3YZ46_9PEZI